MSPPPSADPPAQQHCAEQLLLVSQLMRLVAKGAGADLLLREMLHLMSELLGLHHGRVVLFDAGASDLEAPSARIRMAYGLTREEIARGVYAWDEGITGRALSSGLPVLVRDIDTDPRFLDRAVARTQLPAGPLAFLASPIEYDQRIAGVLACHRSLECERPLENDLALLRILATLAGQGLQRQEMLQQMLPRSLAPPLVRSYLPARLHSPEDLERVLAEHEGKQSRAAQALGMTVRQFGYRLRKARGS